MEGLNQVGALVERVVEGVVLEREVRELPVRAKRNLPAKKSKTIDGKKANKAGIRMTKNKAGEYRWEVQLRGADFAHLPGGRFYQGGIESEAEAIKIRDQARVDVRNRKASSVVVPLEMPVPTIIATYIAMYPAEMGKPMPKHMHDRLINIGKHAPLAGATLADLGEDLLVDWGKRRRADGNKATTSQLEYGYFHRAVTAVASWKKWKGWNPLEGVFKVLESRDLIADSTNDKNARSRLPSNEEMKAIVDWYVARDERLKAGKQVAAHKNCADFVRFSCRQGTREGEQTEMLLRNMKEHADGSCTWSLWRKDSEGDYCEESGTNRRWVEDMPLQHDAYEIAKQQATYIAFKALSASERAKSDLRLFPMDPSNVAGKVWRACKAELGISNLHYHDLRAKAITELCKVMQPTDVMKFSGHRTLDALMIYIRAAKDELAAMVAKTKAMPAIY